ncbi:MAG TPA: hypothetical protein VLX92_01815 [Kofleriaceae bacterium]|nr:hypothetical protein [Kofleriaceae bacterium]
MKLVVVLVMAAALVGCGSKNKKTTDKPAATDTGSGSMGGAKYGGSAATGGSATTAPAAGSDATPK